MLPCKKTRIQYLARIESYQKMMQTEQIPRAICYSLLVKLRDSGVRDLPAYDARVDAALDEFLSFVEDQCRQALKAKNLQFVDECLLVLDRLGADAATGRHDLFWAKIRELQPGSISFGNPTYKIASLPDHSTEGKAYELSDDWKRVINESAATFATALRK